MDPGLATPISEAASVQKNEKVVNSRRFPTADIVFFFHTAALAWFLRVWLWHFTPQAAALPGAVGFGWFTRYLTFCSFTLQLLQLALSCVTAVLQDSKVKLRVGGWADDLACALFSLANAVTIMYYTLELATKDMVTHLPATNPMVSNLQLQVEGGSVQRPPWLGFAVHVSNSFVAWADLLLAQPRHFSRRSERVSICIVLAYTSWILVCSRFNGVFPYPFLNKMPWPQGFLGVMVAAQILFFCLFKLGRRLSQAIQRAKAGNFILTVA